MRRCSSSSRPGSSPRRGASSPTRASSPAPGDYVTTTIGGRPVVVVRGADGVVHGLLNRCAHRGAVVVGRRPGVRQALHVPVPRLDVRRRRPAGRPARSPANHPTRRPVHARPRSPGRRSRTAASCSARCTPIRAPSIEWLGSGHRGLRRDRRPPPGRPPAPGSHARSAWSSAATGSCRGTTPPTASTPPSPTVPTTSSDSRRASTPCSSGTRRARRCPPGPSATGHMVVDQRPGIPQGPWATMRPMPFAEPLERALRRAAASRPAPRPGDRAAW